MTMTERVVKKDRWIIIGGLLLITLLSWLYIVSGAGTGMSAVAMTSWKIPAGLPVIEYSNDWNLSYALTMLLMWWVMMIAMMIPSASPMILLYARVVRHNQPKADSAAIVPTANFAAGYLAAWLLFSIAAVFLQWLLEYSGLLHGMKMWSTSYTLSGLLLIAAGIYQLSSLKAACLRHCRSPVEFISSHWRQGPGGAFRMGTDHGFYCIGCCWSLMALLFVGGAMNLIWIAGLGFLVLLEKTAPAPKLIGRLIAVVLIATGLLLLSANTFVHAS